MKRFTPSSTLAASFPVTTGGEFKSVVTDAMGNKMQSTVTETGGTATVTVSAGAWQSNQSGYGRIYITRTQSDVVTVEASETFRILANPEPLTVQNYG